jgi:XTP/dITP diphosphohydrolase
VSRRLLVATTNRGKQAEFRRLLAGLDAEVVTPDELGLELDVPEPHHTYAENAVAKAEAYCRASGELTLADDSGIEVAALGWGPGVRSARWGGGAGSQAEQLVAAIEGAADRRARMVCALAIAVPAAAHDEGPVIEVFSGVVEGSVAPRPRGDRGFGYDPIFLLPEGRTTAELPEGDKDRLSHRGRAVAAATPWIVELLARN